MCIYYVTKIEACVSLSISCIIFQVRMFFAAFSPILFVVIVVVVIFFIKISSFDFLKILMFHLLYFPSYWNTIRHDSFLPVSKNMIFFLKRKRLCLEIKNVYSSNELNSLNNLWNNFIVFIVLYVHCSIFNPSNGQNFYFITQR